MPTDQPTQIISEKRAAYEPVVIKHNLDPRAFKWLWAKYVIEPNLNQHCTACLRAETINAPSRRGGAYSRKLSRASNPTLSTDRTISMDECTSGVPRPIYICGVSARGYGSKTNYPHNLHAAIVPVLGAADEFHFENWTLSITNGLFTRIPSADELPRNFKDLPADFTTCRIFRWAAAILPTLLTAPSSNRANTLLHP